LDAGDERGSRVGVPHKLKFFFDSGSGQFRTHALQQSEIGSTALRGRAPWQS
jgi:hypothetical protein